jgi:hypothetical protein
MRHQFMLMALLLSPPAVAGAQVSIQIGLPSISIGIDQRAYPQLVAVPGYPVYYDPGSDWNYFFYDGLYWVYERDAWYASSWYNGPWSQVGPQEVPLFILRVPLRYYRHPPAAFRGWHADQPPRWGEHWGGEWQRQRGGWDQWDRARAPAPAPLPTYQRQYSGSRYPQAEQQRALRSQNYRHESSDEAVRRIGKAQGAPPAAARAQPAKEVPRVQPAKEVPRVQPAKEAPRAQPATEPPRQQPAKEAPRAQPAREAPRAQPPREAPRAEPTRAPQPERGRQEKEPVQGQQRGQEQGRDRDR